MFIDSLTFSYTTTVLFHTERFGPYARIDKDQVLCGSSHGPQTPGNASRECGLRKNGVDERETRQPVGKLCSD